MGGKRSVKYPGCTFVFLHVLSHKPSLDGNVLRCARVVFSNMFITVKR